MHRGAVSHGRAIGDPWKRKAKWTVVVACLAFYHSFYDYASSPAIFVFATNNMDQSNEMRSKTEKRTVMEQISHDNDIVLQQETTSSSNIDTELRVFTLTNIDEIETFLQASRYPQSALLVLVAYSESCPQSMEFLWKFQYAMDELRQDRVVTEFLNPIVVQVPITSDTSVVLDHFGITDVPSLFFLKEQGTVLENHVEDNQSHETSDETDQSETNRDRKRSGRLVPLVYHTMYTGPESSYRDLHHGLNHYLTRLRHSTMKYKINTISHREYLDSMIIRVDTLQDLQDLIYTYKDRILRHAPIPLNPHHSKDEEDWIRYLLDDFDEDSHMYKDEFHIICQCRPSSGTTTEGNGDVDETDASLRQFDELASVLAIRWDVLFCTIPQENCDFEVTNGTSNGTSTTTFDNQINHSGFIGVFTVDPRQDWILQSKDIFHPTLPQVTNENVQSKDIFHPTLPQVTNENVRNVEQSRNDKTDRNKMVDTGIKNFLSDLLRPTILWFDRKMTAPVALHPRYRIHAVLFVDFHDESQKVGMRNAVRCFRRGCNVFSSSGIVCLVVPSAETRVLMTFGVDVWSPMDTELTKWLASVDCETSSTHMKNNASAASVDEDDQRCDSRRTQAMDTNLPLSSDVLPTVLVTYRKEDKTGLRRYYLDPPISDNSIHSFFESIITGNAVPESKSSTKTSLMRIKSGQKFPMSKHGVHLLTGHSLSLFLQEYNDRHILLLLYVPTCGHCKRFHIVWNALGDLLRHIGWNDRLVLGRIDVSANEIFVPGLRTNWLPGMFYFGLGMSENPVGYEKTKMADTVQLGSINDPLDLIEWWMDVAGDSIDEVALLESLQVHDEEKTNENQSPTSSDDSAV